MDKLINERGLRHLAEILDDKYLSLGNTSNFLTKTAQTLTSNEKTQVRTNIGAGTSNLTIGTTASTAAAGNHTHDEYVKKENLFEEYNNNGHEYVDLGLPSGTMWATENVKTPNGVEHFAWGDPQEKNTFNWSTYPDNPSGDGATFTKYKTDGKTELDLEDDPANVYFGGDWRSPSIEQVEELLYNCTWTWKDNGFEVVGPNGNKIFLPATGGYFRDSSISNVGSSGHYWLRSLDTSNSVIAHCLHSRLGYHTWNTNSRNAGFTVRPVLEKSTTLKKIKPELLNDYATKDELNALDLSIFKMVSELPTDNIDENKIYLIPSTETEEGNIYTEYTYKNNAWEKLGEYKSDVDLSGYLPLTGGKLTGELGVNADVNTGYSITTGKPIRVSYSGKQVMLDVDNKNNAYLQSSADNLWISGGDVNGNTVLSNVYYKVNNVCPGSKDSTNNLGTASFPWKTLSTVEATIGRSSSGYNLNSILKGLLKFQNSNATYTTLQPSATSAITLNLPSSGGTLALTSQIPTIPSTIENANKLSINEATLDGYYPLTMVESSSNLPKYESLFTKTNIKYNPVQNILETGRVHAHTYTYSEHPENASLVVYNSLDSGNQSNIYTSMRPRIGFVYHDNHVDDRYCGQIVMDKSGFTFYRGASDNSKNADGSWKGTTDSVYKASNGGIPFAALRCGEIKTFVDGEWKDVMTNITSISSEQISTLTF